MMSVIQKDQGLTRRVDEECMYSSSKSILMGLMPTRLSKGEAHFVASLKKGSDSIGVT